MWNHDISAAPHDGTHVILALQNKTTIRSYWCKPLHDPEHWCMLSHKNEPVAWMLWPEHPYLSSGGRKASCPSLATREADESVATHSPSHTDAFAELKAKSRLANAASVEPSVCDFPQIDDVGSV